MLDASIFDPKFLKAHLLVAKVAEIIPGTVIIKVKGGVPSLGSASLQNALVIENKSGGEMRLEGTIGAGTITVGVPENSTGSITPEIPNKQPTIEVSVEEKFQISVPAPSGYGLKKIWVKYRRIISKEGNNALPANGKVRMGPDGLHS